MYQAGLFSFHLKCYIYIVGPRPQMMFYKWRMMGFEYLFPYKSIDIISVGPQLHPSLVIVRTRFMNESQHPL